MEVRPLHSYHCKFEIVEGQFDIGGIILPWYPSLLGLFYDPLRYEKIGAYEACEWSKGLKMQRHWV
jgi:hypothetical protein